VSPGTALWIGLTDIEEEGKFVNKDGELPAYTGNSFLNLCPDFLNLCPAFLNLCPDFLNLCPDFLNLCPDFLNI